MKLYSSTELTIGEYYYIQHEAREGFFILIKNAGPKSDWIGSKKTIDETRINGKLITNFDRLSPKEFSYSGTGCSIARRLIRLATPSEIAWLDNSIYRNKLDVYIELDPLKSICYMLRKEIAEVK